MVKYYYVSYWYILSGQQKRSLDISWPTVLFETHAPVVYVRERA